jgi:hypothetical protein
VAAISHATRGVIEQAGVQIETFERFRFSPAAFLPADPHILGAARRRA